MGSPWLGAIGRRESVWAIIWQVSIGSQQTQWLRARASVYFRIKVISWSINSYKHMHIYIYIYIHIYIYSHTYIYMCVCEWWIRIMQNYISLKVTELAVGLAGSFLQFYVLATCKLISGRVPICNMCTHSWWLHRAAPLGDQATSSMTWYPTQLHYPNPETTTIILIDLAHCVRQDGKRKKKVRQFYISRRLDKCQVAKWK